MNRRSMLVFFKGMSILILIVSFISLYTFMTGIMNNWMWLFLLIFLVVVFSELSRAYNHRFKIFPWEEVYDGNQRIIKIEAWRR